MSTLEQEIANLKPGDHVCLLYDTDAEALGVAAPYIDDGLARDEQCLVIWRTPVLDQLVGVLAARGIEVGQKQARGALLLWPTFDSRFASGPFDPSEVIAYLRTLTQQAVAAGFAGLRLIADMAWTVGMTDEHDKLIMYEALWNDLVATAPPWASACMRARHLARRCCVACYVHIRWRCSAATCVQISTMSHPAWWLIPMRWHSVWTG